MPKYQATAYIRLSYTDDRSSESDSVTNQRKLIENFIERNPDIQIVSEKIDDGYSGIIFDRPAFKEMMQDITDGKINCVIVKDLSRLGREYIETGRYLRRVFPTYGVRFIAITDNIDTAHEGSGDDLTVSVKNIMNEAYCRDISIKTRTSLDIKRRNGDFVGAFPVYGYMKSEENKNLLVPDPYASRVVRDIFRMRLDGTSALRIATVLNEMGILSPLAYKKNNGFPYAKHGYADKEDCKWSATTIIRILQDETYIGTLVQGKQGTPHYKIKQMEQRPSSEWIRVPDAHEPLIAKQDFELVQRIRRLDTRTSPKQDTVYLFSGVLGKARIPVKAYKLQERIPYHSPHPKLLNPHTTGAASSVCIPATGTSLRSHRRTSFRFCRRRCSLQSADGDDLCLYEGRRQTDNRNSIYKSQIPAASAAHSQSFPTF